MEHVPPPPHRVPDRRCPAQRVDVLDLAALMRPRATALRFGEDGDWQLSAKRTQTIKQANKAHPSLASLLNGARKVPS